MNSSKLSLKNIVSDLWTVLWILLGILLILRLFVFQQVTVVGKSMNPSYNNNDLLIINQVDRNFPRGQVVAVYEDSEIAKNANYFTRFQTRFFLKRVICLPGEECEIIGSKVIVYNEDFPEGRIIIEDYVGDDKKIREDIRDYYMPRILIPEGYYFIMGDNRPDSLDSRDLGPFPDHTIFGEVVGTVAPISESELFALPNYRFETVDADLRSKIDERAASIE